MSENQVQKMKIVIWVTGGKGGTGKSTFARGVLEALLAAGIKVVAVDGDPENAQLHRYYKTMGDGVLRTELAKRNGGDAILKVMEEDEPDVILVDVAAGGSQILMRLQDESLFLSDAREMGYDFTIASVVSPIKDSVNMLKMAMDTTQGYPVRHVAVKNLNFGAEDEFELFESSKTKQRFEAEGGTVIKMRSLWPATYGVVDKDDLPFSVATQKASGLPRGDRNRIRQWLTCLGEQVALADGAFGL